MVDHIAGRTHCVGDDCPGKHMDLAESTRALLPQRKTSATSARALLDDVERMFGTRSVTYTTVLDLLEDAGIGSSEIFPLDTPAKQVP